MRSAIAAALASALLAACSANDVASDILGIPRPSEWQERRVRFRQRLPQSRIIVFPAEIDGHRWMSPALIVADVAKVSASAVAASRPANIPPPKVDHFSYRYLRPRLEQYRAWVSAAKLDADYLLFTEIYNGRVPGALVIVMDRNGGAADIKRIHWGAAPPADDRGVAAIIKRCYLDALFEAVPQPCPGRGLS